MDGYTAFSVIYTLMAEKVGMAVLEEKLEEKAMEIEIAEAEAQLHLASHGSLPTQEEREMLDLMALQPPARKVR